MWLGLGTWVGKCVSCLLLVGWLDGQKSNVSWAHHTILQLSCLGANGSIPSYLCDVGLVPVRDALSHLSAYSCFKWVDSFLPKQNKNKKSYDSHRLGLPKNLRGSSVVHGWKILLKKSCWTPSDLSLIKYGDALLEMNLFELKYIRIEYIIIYG